MNDKPEGDGWKRMFDWPANPETYWGIPAGQVDFVKDLFGKKRFRFEVLRIDSEAECQIPFGDVPSSGTGNDESQINFPQSRLLEVAKVVKALKKGNQIGRATRWKTASPCSRIDAEGSGNGLPPTPLSERFK
jgi:hypothetical protein